MKRGEFLLSLIAAPFAAKVLSNTTEAPPAPKDVAVQGSGESRIREYDPAKFSVGSRQTISITWDPETRTMTYR